MCRYSDDPMKLLENVSYTDITGAVAAARRAYLRSERIKWFARGAVVVSVLIWFVI